MEIAALVVSIVSVVIAGAALWRNWRWHPREARFELVAHRGSKLDGSNVYVYAVNVGDVPARGVRYELEHATLTGDQIPARNAEILPGLAGDEMRLTRETDEWQRAAVVVTWYPYPVHRGRRKRQRLSVAQAIKDAPPAADVMKTFF